MAHPVFTDEDAAVIAELAGDAVVLLKRLRFASGVLEEIQGNLSPAVSTP